MSIVITGASGKLGRLTAGMVLDRMPASEVILTTAPSLPVERYVRYEYAAQLTLFCARSLRNGRMAYTELAT